MMIWAAVLWYYVPVILNVLITAGDYMDTSGNRVHRTVQVLFLSTDASFQDDSSPPHTHTHTHTQPEVFSLGVRSV